MATLTYNSWKLIIIMANAMSNPMPMASEEACVKAAETFIQQHFVTACVETHGGKVLIFNKGR